ncbi:hypothetical protein E3U43_018839 [Larimichthys crocea]|nr:hypothetical protein E3U43_018839 [Larimichthys crocea]
MLLPRLPVLSALLVLLLAAGRCTAAAGRLEGRSMLELVGRNPRTRTEPAAELSGHRGVRGPERERRSQQGAESQHRDPRHKEKFIKHLTELRRREDEHCKPEPDQRPAEPQTLQRLEDRENLRNTVENPWFHVRPTRRVGKTWGVPDLQEALPWQQGRRGSPPADTNTATAETPLSLSIHSQNAMLSSGC